MIKTRVYHLQGRERWSLVVHYIGVTEQSVVKICPQNLFMLCLVDMYLTLFALLISKAASQSNIQEYLVHESYQITKQSEKANIDTSGLHRFGYAMASQGATTVISSLSISCKTEMGFVRRPTPAPTILNTSYHRLLPGEGDGDGDGHDHDGGGPDGDGDGHDHDHEDEDHDHEHDHDEDTEPPTSMPTEMPLELNNVLQIIDDREEITDAMWFSMTDNSDDDVSSVTEHEKDYSGGVSIFSKSGKANRRMRDSQLASWAAGKLIRAPGYSFTELYGISVAVSSKTSSLPVMMAIGAECRHPGANVTDYHCFGAVYVYQKDADTNSWIFFQKLFPPQQQVNQSATSYYFGGSVSMQGNLLAVGARGLGAVFIYQYDSHAQRWGLLDSVSGNYNPEDADVRDNFGVSVSLSTSKTSSSLLLVGADEHSIEINATLTAGSVYVFSCSSGKRWTLQQQISMPTWSEVTGNDDADALPRSNSHFGRTVVLDGNTAYISAYLAATTISSTTARTGAVFVYSRRHIYRDVYEWVLETVLLPTEKSYSADIGQFSFFENDDTRYYAQQFGAAVSVQNGVIAVSAPFNSIQDKGGDLTVGAVYVFQQIRTSNSAEYPLQYILTPGKTISGIDGFDNFGSSVAVTVDNSVMVGADGYGETGSIFVYKSLTMQSSSKDRSFGAAFTDTTHPYHGAVIAGTVLVSMVFVAMISLRLYKTYGGEGAVQWSSFQWSLPIMMLAYRGQSADSNGNFALGDENVDAELDVDDLDIDPEDNLPRSRSRSSSIHSSHGSGSGRRQSTVYNSLSTTPKTDSNAASISMDHRRRSYRSSPCSSLTPPSSLESLESRKRENRSRSSSIGSQSSSKRDRVSVHYQYPPFSNAPRSRSGSGNSAGVAEGTNMGEELIKGNIIAI